MFEVFVKDKNNLLDFNIWSCTEYSQDFTGFTINSPTKVVATNEISVKGDTSIKLMPNNDYAILRIPYTFDSQLTYLFTCKLKNNVHDLEIEIRSGSITTEYVYVPVNTEFTQYSLSFTPNNNQNMIVVRAYNGTQACYVDDLILTVV